MENVAEALEFGVEVLRYIDKAVFLAFVLACGYGMFVTVSLVNARHQLARMESRQ